MLFPNISENCSTDAASVSPGAQSLAANVSRLRKARGVSRAELAQRLDWSLDTVVAIEAARCSDLTLDEIDALAGALETGPYALFSAAN